MFQWESTIKAPLFQISPHIWADNGVLYAKTSIIYRVLNLFFYSRLVVINRRTKTVEITITTFWFKAQKRIIPFNDIKFVDTCFREFEHSYGITAHGTGAHDATEIYYVQLILKSSPQPYKLFRFVGEGSRYTGPVGVLVGGDSALDCEGFQEELSRHYAELVSIFTQVPLWKNRKTKIENKNSNYQCSNCSRYFEVLPKSCIYCGSTNLQKANKSL